MDEAAIGGVVEAWGSQWAELGGREDVAWVQLFENRGEIMGCSNPHPHGQIWASAQVPGIPARIVEAQRRYRAGRAGDLLGDYLARELELGERLVCRNEHWVALVPFWALWPFETLLLPLRRVADLPSLGVDEREALAELLRRLCTRYDNLFQCPFPYSMGWRGRPSDGEEHPGVRLHASFLPPLLRSASVRKFLVGYELTAEPQRDLTPEAAAARLRECSERHYGESHG
jgi:UDPglucose--hexose-1-phosphate uridylyltransferase